jgi:hypothetical protein
VAQDVAHGKCMKLAISMHYNLMRLPCRPDRDIGAYPGAVIKSKQKFFAAGGAAKWADLFIAEYCVKNGFTLVTNNTKHFEIIKDLKYTNWIE